jgi:hypothetical protein
MMSLSRLASRSLSRDRETSLLVIVFLRMSGTGKGSLLLGSGAIVVSSCPVFFLPNRSMSVSSVKGAVWPFLRNRSIPQRSLWVEEFRIINGLAEWRVLLLPCWGVGASKYGYLVFE